MNRVFITGIGVISAIGNNVAQNHGALTTGQCGISISGSFPSKYSGILPFGEVPLTTPELKAILQITDAGVTRTTLLALHAAKEAIGHSGITIQQLSSPDTALIGATTVGGMCLTDELYADAQRSSGTSPFMSAYDCASVNLYLQQHFTIGGLVNTINTACSSSANAIMHGARLIKTGLAKRAIVGGVDSLSKFTINGFNALHILSKQACTPFDENRQGLNLGEGAAFLVLEGEAAAAGKPVYGELTGYCNANDAYHPSSLSEDGAGPYQAMLGALACLPVGNNTIDFINAHGTGTENNDAVESRAMLRIFGSQVPPFASTKANTGHTLGAAGAIEAVYSILNLVHQEIYPGLHFSQPITGMGLVPVKKYQRAALNNIMTNSFGFGGNCTSLIFSKS